MSTTKFIFMTGLIAGAGAILINELAKSRVTPTRAFREVDSDLMDLNSAPAEDLKRLGLDDVAVGRIVENRPYRNKLELVSRMVIPETLYGEIRHQVGVREAAESVKVA
jgi:hypothetical protein